MIDDRTVISGETFGIYPELLTASDVVKRIMAQKFTLRDLANLISVDKATIESYVAGDTKPDHNKTKALIGIMEEAEAGWNCMTPLDVIAICGNHSCDDLMHFLRSMSFGCHWVPRNALRSAVKIFATERGYTGRQCSQRIMAALPHLFAD